MLLSLTRNSQCSASEFVQAFPRSAFAPEQLQPDDARSESEASELPLFRQEVLDARAQNWMGRITLTQPLSSGILTLLAVSFATALLVFLFFATYTRQESVQGQLVPSAGLLPVAARVESVVTATRVHEGQSVVRDQVLVELSGEVSSLSKGKTQGAVIGNLQSQLKELEAILESRQPMEKQEDQGLSDRLLTLQQELAEVDRQAEHQREVVGITERRLEKMKQGVQDGTFSQVEFERYQAEALNGRAQLNILARQRLDTEQQLKVMREELKRLPLKSEVERNELRFRISSINQALAQSEAQRAVVLRAPRDGIVASLIVQDGQTVTAGQRLLSILPKGSLLQAELWLPSSAIGFIEAGNPVVLRYPAFPYQKFGQRTGRVLEISRSATAASELTGRLGRTVSEPLYRVLVTLDQQSVTAYGKAEPLKPGMTVDADILLDRRRLIEWVLEPLYGIRRSFGSSPGKG